MLLKLIVCIIAGLGAGVGTGLAGLSAAAVISPMLITFLGFPAYEAVGISLASDVLASAVSAYTYGKHKNLDIKNGLVMLLAVLVFTLVGRLPDAQYRHGRFFRAHDASAGHQIYRAPCHDHEGDPGA